MHKKKLLLISISLVLTISSIVIFTLFQRVYGINTTTEGFIFVKTNSTLQDLENEISPFLKDLSSFTWVAKQKKYTKRIRAGKFKIEKGISNNDLVNLLRSGKQATVNVTFNNQHSIQNLAGRIATQIEADSISILNALLETSFLQSSAFTSKSILGMLVPNSYDFYWNTSATQFRKRMHQEYLSFWTEERVNKAKELNLNKTEVIALASIVQKETAKVSERPMVAGLYLNRIQRGIPLQADPTIIYALKEKYGQEFAVKRVLLKDLKIKSPYNTYLHKGIPPSLIAMPDISSIDAVLFPAKHKYIYMCASVDKIGYHAFAVSLRQHNRNAAKYHRWMNKQGINR